MVISEPETSTPTASSLETLPVTFREVATVAELKLNVLVVSILGGVTDPSLSTEVSIASSPTEVLSFSVVMELSANFRVVTAPFLIVEVVTAWVPTPLSSLASLTSPSFKPVLLIRVSAIV
jgi:hypothetical protein